MVREDLEVNENWNKLQVWALKVLINLRYLFDNLFILILDVISVAYLTSGKAKYLLQIMLSRVVSQTHPFSHATWEIEKAGTSSECLLQDSLKKRQELAEPGRDVLGKRLLGVLKGCVACASTDESMLTPQPGVHSWSVTVGGWKQ